MKAFKVFRRRRDGSLGSLFVDGSRRIEKGKWLESNDSFNPSWLKYLPGWHCHLNKEKAIKLLGAGENRELYQVKIRDVRAIHANGRLVARWVKLTRKG